MAVTDLLVTSDPVTVMVTAYWPDDVDSLVVPVTLIYTVCVPTYLASEPYIVMYFSDAWFVTKPDAVDGIEAVYENVHSAGVTLHSLHVTCLAASVSLYETAAMAVEVTVGLVQGSIIVTRIIYCSNF